MPGKTLIFAVILIICLTSCRHSSKEYRIKTRYSIGRSRNIDSISPTLKFDTTYINGGLTFTNSYDDNGKIISQLSSDGSKTVYTKNGNLFISTKTDSTGKVISRQTEFEDENGKTDSFFVEQNGVVTSARKFVYDKQGNELESSSYQMDEFQNKLHLTSVEKLNYKDSNLISEVLLVPSPILGGTDTIVMLNPKTQKWDMVIRRSISLEITSYYDYFTDKLNTTHGSTNSKNLLKRSVEVIQNDTDRIDNYRYTFDARGRVVTEVLESEPGHSDKGSVTLEYDSSAYTYY